MQMFTRGPFQGSAAGQGALSRWDCEASSESPGPRAEDHAASLWRTIECEIIPRLLVAHRAPSNDDQAPASPAQAVVPEQVARLTELVLAHDAVQAQAFVRGCQADGLAPERLFIELLGPVARRLGALWEADLCDFTQVTIGLWRLQQLVHEYSPAFQRERSARVVTRRALLAPAPGSQHTLGIVIVGEFFRRAGWELHGEATADLPALCDQLGRRWFDLVGLSLGHQAHVPALASAILRIRKASLNPDTVVLVGGPVVALVPDLVAITGADGTAPDGASAVTLAERLLSQRASPA